MDKLSWISLNKVLTAQHHIYSVVKVVLWSRGGLTWRSQVGANPNTHSNPTNLALFGHKITLYRFNKGGSYYCRGGSNGSRGLSPPGPLTLSSEYTLPSVSLVCRKFFPVGCAEDTVNSAVHASACYACRARYYFSNNVCLSVCPSSAGIVSKRKDISTHFLTFW